MNKIKEFFTDWSWKEKAWLAFVLIVQTVAWAIQKESLFMLVMTLTSSLNLVLGAKGKVAGLYFAIINSALYAINCMGIPLYGEVMYNLIYSIPVSAIAIFTWKKNMTKGGEVKFRTMTPKIMLTTVAVTIIGVLGYMQILKWMGGNLPFMDSLTTVVSVVASFLYLLRFSEQWAMWAIVNALSIVMWIMVFMQGDSSATADYHYEDNQLHQLHIRFPELEKNCKRNCIITEKNRGFYVKIIKDQEGHGFHVSMRSVAFCVNDKPKLFFMANRWKVR
nr:nicotinamide riboside transporter PnuC [uncultured Dorea sp.]